MLKQTLRIGIVFIEDFINEELKIIDKYLADYGFDCVPCFNDYKFVWVNYEYNISIICKIYLNDNAEEIIESIWYFKGIYNEKNGE